MSQEKPFLNSLQNTLIHKGRIKMFISFLAISFVIWFFKKFSKEYQEEIQMKIEIIDVPNSYIISSVSESSLNLNIKATGFQLLYYYFLQDRIEISFQTAEYRNNKGYLEVASQFNNLQEQLLSDTEILTFFPSEIEITYQPEFSKKVPVARPKINLDIGYSITKFNIIPDSILVTGPQNLLDEINDVNLNFKNEFPIKSNIFKKFSLVEKDKKLNYNFSEVNLELNVELFSEKKITIPISVSNFPKDRVLKLFPSEAEIIFSSTISNLKMTKVSDFKVGFDYNSIDKEKKTAEVKLLNAPTTANNVRIIPKNVFFLIRK